MDKNVDFKAKNKKANEEQSNQGKTADKKSFLNFFNCCSSKPQTLDDKPGEQNGNDVMDGVEPSYQKSVGNAMDDMRTAAAFLARNISHKKTEEKCFRQLCLAKNLRELHEAIETVTCEMIAEIYADEVGKFALVSITADSLKLMELCEAEFNNPLFEYAEEKSVFGIEGCSPSSKSEMEALFIKINVPEGYSAIVAFRQNEILSQLDNQTVDA